MRIHLSGTMVIMFAAAVGLQGCGGQSAQPSGEGTIAAGAVEKPVLKLGFIKLTDMAPLHIAKAKGFFPEAGTTITLEHPATWTVCFDGVIGGRKRVLKGPRGDGRVDVGGGWFRK